MLCWNYVYQIKTDHPEQAHNSIMSPPPITKPACPPHFNERVIQIFSRSLITHFKSFLLEKIFFALQFLLPSLVLIAGFCVSISNPLDPLAAELPLPGSAESRILHHASLGQLLLLSLLYSQGSSHIINY